MESYTSVDENRFDALARRAAGRFSRRDALGLALGSLLGPLALGESEARNRKGGRKNKKPPFNAFGCLDVGKACNGNNALCCSGICQGKKSKRGRKDRSQCVAHNTGACQANQDSCANGEIPCGEGGICFRTTGQASFCGIENLGNCVVCARDTDCEPVFGAGAACVVCDECDDTQGTGCVPPAA